MKSVTDSKRPQEAKEVEGNTSFMLYSHFATADEIADMKQRCNGGIGT